jgi:hypothetical protein
MKILALVEDLRVNTTSGGICNSNFLSGLIKGGHQIDCYYDYAHSEDFPWLASPLLTMTPIPSLPTHLLLRILNKIPKGNGMVARATGFTIDQTVKIKSWRKSLKTALGNNQYDLILLLGAGNSMLNYFSILGVETAVPIMVNYHDPYPDNQYPPPYATATNQVAKVKTRKSNAVINKATEVSFPSQRLLEWMTPFHPALQNKSVVFPHVNGLLAHLPELEEDGKVILNQDCFNIVHGGSLLGPRNPEFLIRAFKRFIDEDEERKQKTILNIIGRIDTKNKVKYIDLSAYESNIRLIKERISYSKSKTIFSQADVLLIIEAITDESPFMPGKLTDCIEAGKNIMALTPKKSEVSRLLGEKYPYVTETDNEEEIYLILTTLWNLWKNKDKVIAVPKTLLDYVSWENQNSLLNALFTENK